jgi:hypothetical protein
VQRRGGQLGGFVRGEIWLEPGLDPPGPRLLGQHDHRLSATGVRRRTAAESRIARQTPSGVPVTFGRPVLAR